MNARPRLAKGQIMVLFMLLMPVLLGAMALGADFAVIYVNWTVIQKAADAAALAGASQLTGASGSASTVKPGVNQYVNGYACLNGISNTGTSSLCSTHAGSDTMVFITNTDTTVSVGIKRSVPYSFGKLIGLQNASVAAKATAGIFPPGGANGLFPVGLQCTRPCSLANLNPGQGVTFGQKFVGSIGASGNWQWIDVGQGNGASALGHVLQYGGSGTFTIGQTIGSDPGNKANSGPAKSGLAARLASCSAASNPLTNSTDPCRNGASLAKSSGNQDGIGGTNVGAVPLNDPCLVTVPAVDFTGCNGSCSLKIEGFAQVYLEQDSTTSAIDACFVQGSTTSNVLGSSGAPQLGALAPPVLTN